MPIWLCHYNNCSKACYLDSHQQCWLVRFQALNTHSDNRRQIHTRSLIYNLTWSAFKAFKMFALGFRFKSFPLTHTPTPILTFPKTIASRRAPERSRWVGAASTYMYSDRLDLAGLMQFRTGSMIRITRYCYATATKTNDTAFDKILHVTVWSVYALLMSSLYFVICCRTHSGMPYFLLPHTLTESSMHTPFIAN